MWKQVIEYDPCNVKALFRRAQAYLRINELEKAEIDINKALEVDPTNRYLLLGLFINVRVNPPKELHFGKSDTRATCFVSKQRSLHMLFIRFRAMFFFINPSEIIFFRDVKVIYKELKNKQKQYTQQEVEIFSTMLSKLKTIL